MFLLTICQEFWNLEDHARLALPGELQLAAGHGRVDQTQGGRFDQTYIVHIPIPSPLFGVVEIRGCEQLNANVLSGPGIGRFDSGHLHLKIRQVCVCGEVGRRICHRRCGDRDHICWRHRGSRG